MSIPYPEDQYVNLVAPGLRGDLPQGAGRQRPVPAPSPRPPQLTLEKLAGEPTRTIARLINTHGHKASHPAVVAWFEAAGPLLSKAAKIRNPVLHARPSTTADNKQEMFRWHPREQFPVTAEHLRQGIAELEGMVDELYNHRPSLQDFPPS